MPDMFIRKMVDQHGLREAQSVPSILAASLHYYYPVTRYPEPACNGCCNTNVKHTHDGFGRRRNMGELRTPTWYDGTEYF